MYLYLFTHLFNFLVAYLVVDFTDGTQMIPSDWLVDGEATLCYWPTQAEKMDQRKFDKWVKTRPSPHPDWPQICIETVRVRDGELPFFLTFVASFVLSA